MRPSLAAEAKQMTSESHQQQESSSSRLYLAGALAGFVNGAAKWGPDTLVTRARACPFTIGDGTVKGTIRNYGRAISPGYQYQGVATIARSVVNVGFLWQQTYKLSQGAVTFPLQKQFKRTLDQQFSEGYDTPAYTVGKSMLAGWGAAMVELTLHPLDSMKIRIQNGAISGNSVKYFFTNFPALYNGVGVTALRNTFSNPITWGVFSASKIALGKTQLDQRTQDGISSFVFSAARVSVAYPLDTIKTWRQLEDKQSGKVTRSSWQDSVILVRNKISEHGPKVLFRGFGVKSVSQVIPVFLQMLVFQRLIDRKEKPLKAPSTPGIFSKPAKTRKLEQQTPPSNTTKGSPSFTKTV